MPKHLSLFTRTLPEVQLPGGSTTITSTAERLGKLLDQPGEFFLRGGVVMRLDRDHDEKIKLEIIKATALCSEFERFAKLVRVQQTKDGEQVIPATCSEANARLITESSAFKNCLSPINVISACPVLVERNGDLIQISGYDRESGILAHGKPASEVATPEAVGLLHKLLADFRFATPGDKCRGLAALITPALVFGGILPKRAPIDLCEADQSQTGKGYKDKLTTAIYNTTKRTIAQRSTRGVGSVQESFDKAVIEAAPFIGFDNIRGNMDWPWLESFMTEDDYQARIPYAPPANVDPRRMIITLTSNKADATVDLANRASCVRLLKQPDGYQFRSYPEGDLLDHVRANQPRYLGAVFAVVRDWHRRGKPELAVTAHDFRGWARVLSYICREILGAGDLLEGHRAAQERIASPGLNWLRDLAIAVQRAGKLTQWLRSNQLLQIGLDSGIHTPASTANRIRETNLFGSTLPERSVGRWASCLPPIA